MRGLFLLAVVAACSSGNAGEPLFVDATAAAQITFVNAVGTSFFSGLDEHGQLFQRNMGNGVAVGDFDDDGDLDLYLLAQTGLPNRLLRNNLDRGEKTFTDITPAVLADLGMSRTAQFADFDNDGDLDLVLINDDDGKPEAQTSRVFRNDGSWTDVTDGSGFRPVGYLRCGAAVVDYDGDGLLDIYVTNWTALGFQGENRMYRNVGDMRFEDVTAATGLDGVAVPSFTPVFADFNDDGRPDLHVAVDIDSDEFYWNAGSTFVNATDEVGATHRGNDMGVACADFDDDGDLDIYSTNITVPDRDHARKYNVLYVNRRDTTGVTRFVDEALARGVGSTFWGWGTEFVDVENDGDLDLVAVTGFDEQILHDQLALSIYDTPSVLFLNDGTGRFSRRLGTPLDVSEDSRALAAFDYDRDGDLDLLITNVDQPARLIENVGATGHWLGVALRPDAQAFGATVHATIGNTTKRRDVLAGRSYLTGTPAEVHFGLGEAVVVDVLRIRWRDGTEQILRDIAVDQWLRVSR